MDVELQISGKSADRYRAYCAVKLTRRATVQDALDLTAAGKKVGPRTLIRYDGEDIAAEGSVSGESFTAAADKPITRIVAYKGPVETEVVVGSVEVSPPDKSVAVTIIEPPSGDEVVDL